jgi:hypothetical protein
MRLIPSSARLAAKPLYREARRVCATHVSKIEPKLSRVDWAAALERKVVLIIDEADGNAATG